MTDQKPKANIPENMPDQAEAELSSHFSEPSYRVSYEDGSEVRFNVSDIVALLTAYEIQDENSNKAEITYNAELISGLEVVLDKNTYEELKHLKNWDDEKVNGKFNN